MAALTKTTLQQFFNYCTERKLPFAFYRLPAKESIQIIAQKNSGITKLKPGAGYVHAKGFLMVPFVQDADFSNCIIKPDIFTIEKKLPQLSFSLAPPDKVLEPKPKHHVKETRKAEYQKQVRKIKEEIGHNKFSKVVAACVIKKRKPETFNPVVFFKKLCKLYPTAFVSLVYTQEYGLWIGATPEVLLQIKSGTYKTYSLAGTKANDKARRSFDWGKKEKLEQELVSSYIVNTFSGLTKIVPALKGPETIAAANLLHLRTTFTYKNMPVNRWQKVSELLHPTPAVAGLPKKAAIDLIQRNEKNRRGFYSGYLGPVNLDKEINLFVNLRCMQVLKNKFALYVGCGITADSKPADEWEEIKLKAQTLLSPLQQNNKVK